MINATVASEVVAAALANVPEGDGLRRSLLLNNGIDPEAIHRPGERIAIVSFANTLRDAMIALQDEQLGHGAAPQPPGTWGTMAQYVIDADNLGHAIRRLARFYRLVPWGIETRYESQGENATFTMRPVNPEQQFSSYLYESFLFYFYQFCCWMIDQKIPVVSAGFNFKRTSYSDDYAGVFSAQNVDYEQEYSYLTFASSYNFQPIKHNAIALKKLIEHTNLALFNQYLQLASWAEKVEQALGNNLFQHADIISVAGQLGVHPHTLRTRLKEEGRQFNEVRDNFRLKIALGQLKQPGKSIEEIAIALGYSETSAFSRAFKRWTKLSPQNYRDQSN